MGDTHDEIRKRNEQILLRFIAADSAGAERRAIWADDAVFELPLQGKIFRGVEAILARGRDAKTAYREFERTDLKFYPMLDPNLFLVTHGANEVLADGRVQHNEYVHIFELGDGRVIRRIEYHLGDF